MSKAGPVVVALSLLISVCCMLLAFGSSPVTGSLVAYYSFDGTDSLSALSGNCPNVVPTASASGGATVTSTSCRFSNCLQPGSGFVDTGAWRVFQGPDTSKMTIAAWVTTPSRIAEGVILYKSSLISLSYTTCLLCPYTLKCAFTFNAQQSLEVTVGNSPFSASTAYHVACTYDGQQMCLYINGASKACSSIKSVFTEGSTDKLLIGSDGTTSWGGTIDEVKVYDHALTAANVALLYGASGPNDAPTVQMSTNGTTLAGSYSAPALSTLDVSATVIDARTAFSGAAQTGDYAAGFGYSWDALTSQCGIVEVLDGSGIDASVKLIDIGSYTLHLCASDGELASEKVVSMFITASKPQLSRQPTTPTIEIPGTPDDLNACGSLNYPISVEADGLPAPSYQWQQLVTVEYNITTNSTDSSNSTTNSTIATRDSFYAEREIIFVDEFHDIVGQTGGTLLINGTTESNGTMVRCLIYNGGGSVLTNNFTIFVSSIPIAPPSGPYDGGDDGTKIAIIAGAVGGGGGLLVLCCLALVIGALVWGWRRGRSPYRRLKQPDYVALAYGDVTDDVALPKKQLDQFHMLERLLMAPGLRLALAILRTSTNNIGETDRVCRALLRVLEDNQKGADLIMASITAEVERADEESTLFRANSVAAKLFNVYIKMAALSYLWHTLVLSVHSLNDNAIETYAADGDSEEGGRSSRSGGSQMHASRVGRYKIDLEYGLDDDDSPGSSSLFTMSTMELDPSKISDAGDLTINTLELWLVAQKLLKYITDSERRMPRDLRKIVARLHEEVGAKFNDTASYRAMGGFYFLRFICPALMAPQAFGLLEEPPHPVAQRQLILVSKVLQNLANDTLPGAKEAYMERLNSFITTNQPVLAQFYEEIVDQANKGKQAQANVPEAAKNDALLNLRQYIVANVAAIEIELRADADSDEERESAEDVINALNYVLKQMGDLDGEGKFISDEDLGDLDL